MTKGLRLLTLVVCALAIPACGSGKKRRPIPPAPVPGTVIVTPTSGLISTEAGAGGTAQFTVVLGKAPTADVTIALGTTAPGEGAPNQASLTFTSANWDTPQTVLVIGINDDVADGDQAYTITLAPCVSTDLTYVGIDPADVSVTNVDDDIAGFVFDQTSGLVTTENGGTATFNVTLSSKPTADVTFDLSSDNPLEGTVSPLTLTFTAAAGPDAWNAPHTVTVTGVNDAAADGPTIYHIVTTDSVSGDANYSAKVVPDVTVTNNDNDTVGISATPTSGLLTSESGGTDSFTVVLNTAPTLAVTIAVTSSNPAAGKVSSLGSPVPGTTLNLTFDNSTWNTPQTVTLTGVNDVNPTVNAPVAYTIQLDPSASLEPAYSLLPVINLSASNLDDDVAGITVSRLSGLVTSEAVGGTDTFTVRLDTIPSAPVIVNLLSSNTAEGTTSASPLIFAADVTALDPQTVTLTGVPDGAVDGNQPYTVTLTVDPTTTDAIYAALSAIVVNATNNDINTPGIVLSKTSVLTDEGGLADTFTVALTSIPSATVTVTFAVTTNAAEAAVTPTLTFLANATALDPQTVTVTGQNDAVVDGNVAYVITGTPSGGDANYGAALAFTVDGINNDNDIPVPTGAGPFTKTPGAAVPAGAAGAWDAVYAQEPTVVALGVGGPYEMWYEGLNAAGTKHEQIGRATSPTGVVWTKDVNPVFSHTGASGFDSKGVGDPSVIRDVTNVTAPYQMWYSGRKNAPTKNQIGRATSLDGITWTRSSTPVLSASQTFDAVGVSGPHVILDATNLTAPYQMWYTALDATNVNRIGRATSLDGITWTKTTGAVLGTGTAGSFDAASVKLCAVLLDGGTYRMWYVGLDVAGVAGRQKLGFAQSPDGITWTKFAGNPVLTAGAPGAFDEKNIWSPWVILEGVTFKMWYGGEDNAGTIRIGYAQTP